MLLKGNFLLLLFVLTFCLLTCTCQQNNDTEGLSLRKNQDENLSLGQQYIKRVSKYCKPVEFVGMAIVLFCGICYFCCCYKHGLARPLMDRIVDFIKSKVMHKHVPEVKTTPDLEFQRLKQMKNYVSTNSMSYDEFQKVKAEFMNLVQSPNSVFEQTQSGQTVKLIKTRITQSFSNQFMSKIELSGRDQKGSWTGKGYFLASYNGPYVWWMKEYTNKQSSKDIEGRYFLVYESTSYSKGQWSGRFYNEIDEYDMDHNGNWSLRLAEDYKPIQTGATHAYYNQNPNQESIQSHKLFNLSQRTIPHTNYSQY